LWRQIFGEKNDPVLIRAFAEDPTKESRVRALAFNWLRGHGYPVPPRELLGTVTELPMPGGLDTVAAYVDGRARYINQSGKMLIFESAPLSVAAHIQDVLSASRVVVGVIGPWDKERLPPPEAGNIRISFIVSDGLYFAEGPANSIRTDGLAGPAISAAFKLLKAMIDASTAAQNSNHNSQK